MLDFRITREASGEWDGWVDRQLGSSPFQMTRWGVLTGELRGSRAIYMAVEEDGHRCAQCLMLKEGMFSDRLRRHPRMKFILPIVNRALTILNVMHGPIYSKADRCISEYVIDKIIELAIDEGVGGISFTSHPLLSELDNEKLWEAKRFSIRREATFLVDLKSDFIGKFHRSVRKNVRKAQRQGVTVRLVKNDELLETYELIKDFRKRAGLMGFSYSDFVKHVDLWGDRRCLFAAFYDAKQIASLGVLLGSGLLIEVEAADSPICREKGINANDLLKCEIMKWGYERGFRWFDLAGVAVEPKDQKEINIRRFKAKFGGDYVEFPSFHLTMSSIRGWGLTGGKRIAEIIRGREGVKEINSEGKV